MLGLLQPTAGSVTIFGNWPFRAESQGTSTLRWIWGRFITTDTGQGLMVSGRGIRSEKHRRHRAMGKIQKKKERCQKGSRRTRRLAKVLRRDAMRVGSPAQRHPHRLGFCRTHHVGTRYVGNPDGARTVSQGPHQNRPAPWKYGKAKNTWPTRVKGPASCASPVRNGEPPAMSDMRPSSEAERTSVAVKALRVCRPYRPRRLRQHARHRLWRTGRVSPASLDPRIDHPVRAPPGHRRSLKISPWAVVNALSQATGLRRSSGIGATR